MLTGMPMIFTDISMLKNGTTLLITGITMTTTVISLMITDIPVDSLHNSIILLGLKKKKKLGPLITG